MICCRFIMMRHHKTTVSNHTRPRLDKVDERARDNRRVKKNDSRTILADNLRRMISAEGTSVRAWAIAKGLDVRFIDRLTKGSHAVTLDKLEEVAAALGCEPWHLLLPGFNPDEPPEAPVSAEDKVLLARLRRMLGS